MNKKGFTLVELLAVIAILAILVVVALPNVLGMFNQAKEDTFATETKDMVRIVQQQYLANFGKHSRYAIAGSTGITEANIVTCDSSTTLSAGQYCKIDKEAGNLTTFIIEFDTAGKVTKLDSKDSSYEYTFTKSGSTEFDVKNVTANDKA